MNKVTLIGRLGRDPESRYTQGGSCVCNLAVATTERRKDGDNWVEHTEWHRVTVFGTPAQRLASRNRWPAAVARVGEGRAQESVNRHHRR